METITAFTKIDFPALFISICIILTALKFITGTFEWIVNSLGLETKWIRQRNEKHDLLIQTAKNLDALQKKQDEDVKQYIKQDEIIRKDLENLTSLFIEKSVDDMRWSIINFANMIAGGERCNKDSYQHCHRTYEKYEKIINENNLTNGEVELSMEIINDSYKEKMKHGF